MQSGHHYGGRLTKTKYRQIRNRALASATRAIGKKRAGAYVFTTERDIIQNGGTLKDEAAAMEHIAKNPPNRRR
jgi:hypothetical protein